MSLIASLLHLDRSDIQALRITDPYSLHRVVYGLYPDVRDETERSASVSSGILWADQGGDVHGRKILLLANRAPSETAEGGRGRVDSRAISEGFLNYPSYRFKVIVNPTRRDSASGKLIPVKGREAVAHWFAERAPVSWGFAVSRERLQVDRLEVLRFNDKAKRPVTLAQAHVTGLLSVTDHALFQRSFAQGIGRGRSFGCGLMQIVPLSNTPIA